MNNTKSSVIDMKPKDATNINTVLVDKVYSEGSVLPEYIYRYQASEQHWDKKRHAADFIWSKHAYRLDQNVEEPGNRVLYYLQDAPDRVFVHEELMHVSEYSQIPPDWLSEWK